MKEPKIRFKGFKGEWETSRLDCCVEFLDNLRKPIDEGCRIKGIYPYYGASGIVDYVNDYIFDEELILLSEDGANITDRNYPICFLAKGKYWVNNHAHVLKTKEGFVNYFVSNAMERKDYSQYNTGMAMPKLNKEVCKNIPLAYPHTKEQQSIASFFTTIDAQISASTSRLASLKQIKAASLQAMFPQEGETVPKLRFKGFEWEWEKHYFSSFTYNAGIKNRDNLPLESYSISNEYGFIPQNEQFENGGTMASADKRMYYIVSPNSFAYNPARINVGSLGYYSGKKEVIVSSLYEVFKTKDNVFDDFLNYWFKTNLFKKQINLYQEGGVRLYFFYDKLCKCDILLPSIAEQRAIASYFTNLDRQITLQSQRLEKLKQIKAACLDKMFV